ncbi:MAG TPA: hypothetical protein VGB73_14095 [Pyrinomonadaceae bacterium]
MRARKIHLSMRGARRLSGWCLMWAALWCGAWAQSTSVDYPAPVLSNEVEGRIAPRDIGDARLTRHFYTFNGREGDLLLTIETRELDGNIDIFTASGLRPLATVTLYAGAASGRISRSVYLRGEQALILRVEARAASETEGTYRVRFEGAFAPASGAQAVPPEFVVPTLPAESARRDGNVRRATATGARIEEPPTERPPTETAATTEAPTNATDAPASTGATASTPTNRATTPRTRAGRSPRRSAASRTPRTNPSAEAARTDSSGAEASTPEANAPRAGASSRRTNRRTARNRPAPARERASASTDAGASPAAGASGAAASPGASASAAAAVVTATRLVIETKDGERIEREMSGVRRVSVENNQVVIVGRDGRTQRVPMVNVERMSIEP